jgi:hypothetical protein
MFNNNPYMTGGYQPIMQNPYQARLNAMQGDFMSRQDILRVNGENGAKMINLAPNGSALALDENAPILWVVQADGAGYKTVTPFSITPYQAATTPDYNTLEARIKRLEDMLNEKSDFTDAKQRKSANFADAE